MKKILLISNFYKNKLSNFTIPSLIAAQKIGYEFHFAANTSFSERKMILNDENQYHIKIHNINFSRNPFNPQNFKAYKALKKLIKNEQYEIIHCNTPIGGLLGRLAARSLKIKKVIYTAHGFHFYKGSPLKNWLMYYPAERFLARYTQTIVTMNEEDFALSKKFKCKKCFYVPGVGIDVNKIKDTKPKDYYSEFNIPQDATVLIAVGELIKRKNYETLIKSFSKLNNKKIYLLICGTGVLQDKLNALIKKLNCENNIKMLGFRDDVFSLLKFSDIFVMTTFQEGLPRVVMEAMAAGLPCIVSDIRGNTDLIDECKGGYLIKPRMAKGFTEKINYLSNNKDLMLEFGKYNENKINNFDTKIVMEKMKEIYEDIIK